jgi:uncharacterized membrane protein
MTEAGNERMDALSAGFYRRYAVQSTLTVLALWVLGYWPTVRLAPDGGVVGMLVGTAVSLLASWVGTLPVYLSRHKPSLDSVSAAMGAIAVRLAVAMILALATALSGFFRPAPLLIWIAVGHAALLVADTFFAQAHMQAKARA